MKVYRKYKVETDHFKLGDKIRIKLPGEKHTATAIKEVPGGMMFIFDECLDDRVQMNQADTTDGGYPASYLRKVLVGLQTKFPEKIRKRMLPSGIKGIEDDKLWILSLEDIRGNDQIRYFKNEKNRVATIKKETAYWWLRDVVSASYFAIVGYIGYCYHYNASDAWVGVRPAFALSSDPESRAFMARPEADYDEG